MKLFKEKKERKVIIHSIEGRARPLPGIPTPSREEYEKAVEKFYEKCQERLGIDS